MEVIAISEFKATCLKLLEKIKNTGQPLLITKKGVPIALVSAPPVPEASATSFGAMKDDTEIIGDIVAPLSDGNWEVLR